MRAPLPALPADASTKLCSRQRLADPFREPGTSLSFAVDLRGAAETRSDARLLRGVQFEAAGVIPWSNVDAIFE